MCWKQAAVWQLVGQVREQLVVRLAPDGFNVGLNDGLAEGQNGDVAAYFSSPR